MSPPWWRIAVRVPAGAVPGCIAALEPFGRSVLSLEAPDGGWEVQAIATARPPAASLDLALAVAAAAAGVPVPVAEIAPLADRDWVADGLRQLPAVRIGCFFVYGRHVRVPVPPGRIGLVIDAGLAFGSGHHASTLGCLAALSSLRGAPIARALDVGCGSGILAIAAARALRIPVLACDIDPAAVAETIGNARRNGVAPLVRCTCANGYAAPLVRSQRPFDLIFANILVRPLARLAPALAAHLAPRGRAVLAGFLERDAARVLAAHRAHGLRLERTVVLDGWATLVLAKPSNRG
jgi:ribosomal protein L11 methyltransferase